MQTGTAVAMALIVAIAIGGFIVYGYVQQKIAAERARDPATLIGQGIGSLVGGIVAAVAS